MEAWHFTGDTLRDGRPVPPDGDLLRHDGNLELHASERVMDALQYALGNTICRVKLGGEIRREEDKLCATERTILWRIDAETLLFEFARWAALQVAHLWECPEVVRRYLETGDPQLKDAARYAARYAACAAERDAANAAASDAAAWDAAWYAERDAANAAANAAAWAAARPAAAWDAAWYAARYAANAAAWNTTMDDEMDDAWDAAWAAAWDVQNDKLTTMILASREVA